MSVIIAKRNSAGRSGSSYRINLSIQGASNFIVVIRRPSVIRKVKSGYKVVSTKGKNLGGPYKTLEEAKKRLRQVEFFKHRKG